MAGGWIKLYRKMSEWGWFRDSHTVHLFICLLLSAAVCTCLCLFSPEKNSLYLGIALGSLILSSLCRVATRRRRLK